VGIAGYKIQSCMHLYIRPIILLVLSLFLDNKRLDKLDTKSALTAVVVGQDFLQLLE
jgi:hypothetical protein